MPGPAEQLRDLLPYAVLAPSRNNAQPWLFEIEGDELRLYADHRRTLRAADPLGRELVLACGAALFNLRVAAAFHGWCTSVETVAAHRRDALLARLRLEERCRPTELAARLFSAIALRRTNRLPLDSRDPPAGLVAHLVRDAFFEGATLRTVEAHERSQVAELVAEGDRLQWADPAYRAELASWSRVNGSARRDGLPGWARGMSAAASLVQPLLARFADQGASEAERDRRRALSTRALLVLSSRRDTPRDWLAAGQALQRVLLRAAAAGLHAAYLNQPIEVPPVRERLAAALGEPGRPQIMLRIGYGLEVRAPPRRPVAEVLRAFEPAPGPPQALALYRPEAGAST
jgi:hypothetical protein